MKYTRYEDLQQARNDVAANKHDVAEFLRVAGDAADDLAGVVLVVEDHVAVHCRSEGIFAQLRDHVADDARESQRRRTQLKPNSRNAETSQGTQQ